MIMEAHGVFECHREIHPHMPPTLREHRCWGRLWFEHPNGGGKKSGGSKKLPADIIAGRQNPKDFMVLCQLHQIWNQDFPSTHSNGITEDASERRGNDLAPERKGVIAARESPESEGGLELPPVDRRAERLDGPERRATA